MKILNTTIAYLVLLLGICGQLEAQVLVPSEKAGDHRVSLNGKWKFKHIKEKYVHADSLFYQPDFDVAQWADIKVPGNWEMQGFSRPVYGKKEKKENGLYRKEIEIPAGWKGKQVHICFDGVQFEYTVWVNGKYAGEFDSSFNRKIYDISPLVNYGGNNTIAVRVSTTPKGWQFDTNDDWTLCGIYRDVFLFSVPAVHLKDLTVQTRVENGQGSINIHSVVEKAKAKSSERLKMVGRLFDPAGRLVKEFMTTPQKSKVSDSSTLEFNETVSVSEPSLWTAETPDLYTLRLELKDKDKLVQTYTERLGIRELSWDNGILKLNGSPLKLRGVNHHDLSPTNGRAISDEELLEDILLMKKGNINLLRTSHYPPKPRLLELCDSLGMYVIDEVPIGYGDELLGDSTYLSVLMRRAEATVARDKNHPSVIIWSVGNENPLTDICLITGRRVKHLDGSRPYLFAQTPTVFKNMVKEGIPDSIDMLDYHYPLVEDLEHYSKIVKHPWIASEYAHSMGLDAGHLESIYESMYQIPGVAGGAIWMFADQGILRQTEEHSSEYGQTPEVWATKNTIYDSNGIQGTDGVVYANRVPQVDFWEMRKVFSPVKALDDTLAYLPGRQTYGIRLNNRYDFTNLSEIDCRWQLMADTKVLEEGKLRLDCQSHATTDANITVTLPSQPTASYYYIRLSFSNKDNEPFYEKVYPVELPRKASILAGLVADNKSRPLKDKNMVTSDFYSFSFSPDCGNIQVRNRKGKIIITEGIYARTGRKPTISQNASRTSRRSRHLHSLWDKHLLKSSQAEIKAFDNSRLSVNPVYRADTTAFNRVTGEINYNFSEQGYIDVSYSLKPQGEGESVEAGVSFLIPESFTEFRWIGKGPYEAYPGKERLSEFGFYHLNSADLYFAGNRQDVDCAVFSDKQGNGFILIADKANISVERNKHGLVVSHNAFITGRWNKYTWPVNMLDFRKNPVLNGKFTIVPLTEDWPLVLRNLLGEPDKTVVPYKPFYDSYDQ